MEVVALHHDGLRPRGRPGCRVGRVGGGVAARAGSGGRDEVGRRRTGGARSSGHGGDGHRGAVVHPQADGAGRGRNRAHLREKSVIEILKINISWLFYEPGRTGIPRRAPRR